MNKKNRTYTTDFKEQAIQLVDSSGKSAAEIERDLGITPGLLTRWKRKAQGQGTFAKQAPPFKTLNAAEKRIKHLERENALLRQERDILKKTVVIFGNNPSR